MFCHSNDMLNKDKTGIFNHELHLIIKSGEELKSDVGKKDSIISLFHPY